MCNPIQLTNGPGDDDNFVALPTVKVVEPKKTSVQDFKRAEDMMQDLLFEQLNLPAGETEDWALAQVNVEDTAVRSLNDEFKRLQVLKSYNVAGT